jgi:redox-sensitive bicupin YhaK (pirin superfamily)
MTTIRRSNERGHANHGWLDSRHTFSFADYHDPAHMGFRSLRVINDDRVAPGRGFGSHAHRDMEIISYVLEGRLAHRDSMGERHVLEPNTIQAMSAGTGIVHSEFNASETDPVHFLQIWIEPAQEDVKPSYQQIAFDASEKQGRFRLLAGPHADHAASMNGSAAVIHQDAWVYAAELRAGEELSRPLAAGRFAWVQMARGGVTLNGLQLADGDGAAISSETGLSFAQPGPDGCEFILFDLA